MVTDWSFLLLALSFGVILGVFNTIGTVIDPILDAFNMTSASSFVGAMFIVGGLIGARLTIEKGSRWVFGFLVVVMFVTGVKLVGSSILKLLASVA